MKHKHHLIPRHAGGTDDPENLVELTIEEHAEAHRKLYEETGNIKDYTAFRLLSGTGEKHHEISSLGGKISGAKNRDSGHMSAIRKLVDEEKRKTRALEVMFEKKNNCFLDPEKKLEVSRKGGSVQGKANAESGHCARISKETAAQRSEKMKNRRCITNGTEVKMIRPEENIEDYPGFVFGRPRRSK